MSKRDLAIRVRLSVRARSLVHIRSGRRFRAQVQRRVFVVVDDEEVRPVRRGFLISVNFLTVDAEETRAFRIEIGAERRFFVENVRIEFEMIFGNRF